MDVASTTTTQQSQTSTVAATEPSTSENDSLISSDFETFLRLLTAQLENQDPLNPLESTDFSTQLATFSGVEQQVLTNDLLKDLSSAMGADSLGQMADWVGRDIRAPMDGYFDGAPITLYPEPAEGADGASLLVRDANGALIQRLDLPTTAGPLEWAGVTNDGSALPYGTYEFTVESRSGDQILATDIVEVYGRVTEARLENGGVELVLPGGITVSSDVVNALRDPAAADGA
ncbi:MAG: flagellar hook capping FlgD N-terminal domain-containing protein [Pseudomonadota bacterium]